MARCWTCGTHVSGYRYNCGHCENLSELKSLRNKIEIHGGNLSERLDYIAQVQQQGLTDLKKTLSEGLAEVASSIEWGFGELNWQLQQQTDILRSIDHSIKTPSETQANEWRMMAEELRRRGTLEDSEEFYLKALEINRLDYRIYVGLAETYIQEGQFGKAKSFLERSLPHAPKREIDYKSYSYRLIGHIYACDEDYATAVSILRHAIDLSPNYADGYYDYAQYCAQISQNESSLSSLEHAILAKSLYWYLAQYERNFDPIRIGVTKLISKISTEASRRVKDAIAYAESELQRADRAISEARQALSISREKDALRSTRIRVSKNAVFGLNLLPGFWTR